jgi:hypothetical protein
MYFSEDSGKFIAVTGHPIIPMRYKYTLLVADKGTDGQGPPIPRLRDRLHLVEGVCFSGTGLRTYIFRQRNRQTLLLYVFYLPKERKKLSLKSV